MSELIHGDCLEVMRRMSAGSVDLVVTSPPYNLRNSSSGKFYAGSLWYGDIQNGYDGYGDDMPHDRYVDWQRDCLSEMLRLIPDTGAIFYNHKWRSQNNLLQDRSDIMQGFPVRQIIIWDRGHGVDFNSSYFVPVYEVVYLLAKPKWKVNRSSNSIQNVWRFPPEHNNPHPAPFPIALPQRCIDSTNARTVLDPFMGSGTTAIAAIRAGREWIGIEKSEKYCQMAEERIAHELMRPTLL